jgi:hypothetical protein
MRTTIRTRSGVYEILQKGDSLLSFRDVGQALSFLREFASDPAQMVHLRRLLAGTAFGEVDRLEDPEVLEQLAPRLVAGRIMILKSGLRSAVSTQETLAEEEVLTSEKKTPVQKKTHWIEIKLIDTEGNPIAGERYRIRLPDGAVEEGYLDSFGHAEYNNINPGTCQVTFPDLDADVWERV